LCFRISSFFSISRQTQRQFFTAAAVFLGSALGIEMTESYYAGLHAASNFQLSMLAAVEEGLEMAGVIVFINALLTYIAHHHEDVLLRFSDRKQNPSSVISINRHAA
jgi:hypothetical protein